MKSGNGNKPPDGIDRRLVYVDLGQHTRNLIAAWWLLAAAALIWMIYQGGCQ
jgi:hypothetical protein